MATPESDNRSDRLVRWARWLTGIWLALGGLVAFLKRDTLAGLALNDIGDALAGLCAPIAFLWLVITALLQKFELEAQRAELKQNREALLLQVQQLNNSVEQQAAQTQIMKDEYERSLQASLNSQLRRILIDDHSWYMSELSNLGARTLGFVETGGAVTLSHDFSNVSAKLLAENRISEAIIGIDAELDAIAGLFDGAGRRYDPATLALMGALSSIVQAFHHSLAAAVQSHDGFQRNAVAAADYELGVNARTSRLAALHDRLVRDTAAVAAAVTPPA
ncbi:hypothetical protein [Phreatobacter stygius]|uniref:Uncharacterized protein n=1 Tax=Phreatobacter stygius TaxID=1940610 RepID=A0A4D7AZW2_9HYPH|nr:hypothetical protein [Phreatobacter stygius]QCI64303.1 hypothetical protein E8M01_08650 [Phreatobacter stygius]